MSVTRRNVAAVNELSPRSAAPGGSMWQQEADDYWKQMEPAKRFRRRFKFIAIVLIALAVGSGTVYLVRAAWLQRSAVGNHETGVSSTALDTSTDGVAPSSATVAVSEVPAATPMSMDSTSTTTSEPPVPTTAPATAAAATAPATTAAATAPATSETTAPATFVPVNPAFSSNPAAAELLRARCRVRGVQTRWHEETCRKLCTRDPQNSACMNGCSYGSITVTKLTCDTVAPAAIPTATQCPNGVSCSAACKAYDAETPYPDLRNSCERACANVVPSSCARILQIHRDLYRGMLQ